MQTVKTIPATPIHLPDPADHIVNGQPGKQVLHKVGSAKQYATKSCGRVCNQAKFPMSEKSSPRKRG